MRSAKLLLVVLLAGLTGRTSDAAEIQWLDSIEQARQIAASTHRLVLVHFWSTTCKPCSQLEKDVYNYPGIGPQIGASFVPVKVNVDQHPAVRQQFNIEFVPTDLVLAPDGTVVAHRSCPLNRFEYIAGLAQVAASYTSQAAGPYANLAAGAAGTAVTTAQSHASQVGTTAKQLAGNVADEAAGAASHLGDRYQHLAGNTLPAAVASGTTMPPAAAAHLAGGPHAASPPSGVAPSAEYPPYVPPVTQGSAPVMNEARAPSGQALAQQASAILPSHPAATGGAMNARQKPAGAAPIPPLGLDGTCPVELVDNERWVSGDRRWGAIHRGKLYLFASQAHQQKFLANPDYYSPAISGNDPVLAVDQRQFVAGKRQHGLFYDKRVFLFASEETLARFYQDPLRYAEGIRNVGLAVGQ